MILRWLNIWRAYLRLREYEPNKGRLSPWRISNWVNQFPDDCRDSVALLAANLEYFSKKRIISDLETLHERIATSLEADRIPASNIVYIAIDDPSSSSSLMCKFLRDQVGLSDANFLPFTSGTQISDQTRELRTGALVYVDDFSGSGKQFVSARKLVREYISGIFSEFFLIPCICEEALEVVKAQQVQPIFQRQHTRSERPLLADCGLLDDVARTKIVEHSNETWKKGALGFRKLATNIVFYHATPNTNPKMFRGDVGQSPRFGIVPRWEDLGHP